MEDTPAFQILHVTDNFGRPPELILLISKISSFQWYSIFPVEGMQAKIGTIWDLNSVEEPYKPLPTNSIWHLLARGPCNYALGNWDQVSNPSWSGTEHRPKTGEDNTIIKLTDVDYYKNGHFN